MSRSSLTVLVVAALLVTAVAVATVGTAQPTGSRTITSCTTITDPGTYTLGADISSTADGPCIDVDSGDVVLDGNGHTLVGDGDGVAVSANRTGNRTAGGYGNVTVRDLSVDSWGTGLRFVFAPNATVTGVSVTDADLGVELGTGAARPGYEAHADGAVVTDSTFERVGTGVLVTRSDRVAVRDDTFRAVEDTAVGLDTVSDAAVRDNEFLGGGTAVHIGARSDASGEGSHDNVVASNRVVDGSVDVALDDGVTRNRIVDNDVTNGSVVVSGDRSYPSETLVADNTLTDGEILVELASNVTVADNVLTNPGTAPRASIHLRDAGRTTVRDNRITGANVGVLLEQLALENAVRDNVVTDSETGVSIRRSSVNNTVAGNTLRDDGNGVEVALVDSFRDGTNTVRGNDIVGNTNGLLVLATDRQLVVERNDVRENENGITVRDPTVCSAGAEGAELVAVHGNVIADNAAYGVLNRGEDVLNATGNYWGARDGPTSADDPDAPFTDPVTGDPADGHGSAVSEDPSHAGQSNVHFDAWLTDAPESVGASDAQ